MAFGKVTLTGASSTIKEGWTAFNTLIDDLLAVTSGKGASQIGVYDAAGNMDAVNVEDALAEIYSDTASTRTLAEIFDENSATTTGLTWGYKAGSIRINNTITDVSAGTIGLSDDATNYIEITQAGVVSKNTSSFTAGRVPIREITTSGGVQTVSTDKRVWFTQVATSSATVSGIVELATGAETVTGTDTERAVTPAGLTSKIKDENDMASDSASHICTQQSIKAYVDGDEKTVAQGGTGLTTITDHGVMVGSGTSAVTVLGVGTNGQVLVGSTGADPVFASITAGEGIDISVGAGTLQIDCEVSSSTNKGVVELATDAETLTGTDTGRAITPANLAAKLAASGYLTSVVAANLGAACVAQAKLKTSQGSVSHLGTTLTNYTLPGGEYGFYPQTKTSTTGNAAFSATMFGNGADTIAGILSYSTNVSLKGSVSVTIYAQQRYVTASGEVYWVFALRDYETGLIIGMYEAPDHPCFGNGAKPSLLSHPFASAIWDDKESCYKMHDKRVDIMVINPAHEFVDELKQQGFNSSEGERSRSLLEVINTELNIVDNPKLDWPLDLVTVGVRGDIGMVGEKSDIIKKQIPKMPGFLTAEFKAK